jgi:phospholipid/cholesterol/gamma-HCH transport system permease protein
MTRVTPTRRDVGSADAGRSTLEDWVVGQPGVGALVSAGGMARLFAVTVRQAALPPYPWTKDFVVQCSLATRRCMIPLLLANIMFAVGIGNTAVAGILQTLGTTERTGLGFGAAYPREVAYWATAMVFAGVVGSAVTADLGSRKIREELDALRVLGVDPVKQLVVPRVLALTVVAPLFGWIATFVGIGISALTAPLMFSNVTLHDYIASIKLAASSAEMISLTLRMIVTGAFVAIVASYKGLNAKGGAEGVGRAVNQSVVITFLSLWLLDVLWNSVYLSQFPQVQVLKG